MPKTVQPTNSYFFPNPFGDNVAYTIEAASLEEAHALLQADHANQPAAPEPAIEPEPSPEPAPSMEPSTAAAEPAEAETKENN